MAEAYDKIKDRSWIPCFLFCEHKELLIWHYCNPKSPAPFLKLPHSTFHIHPPLPQPSQHNNLTFPTFFCHSSNTTSIVIVPLATWRHLCCSTCWLFVTFCATWSGSYRLAATATAKGTVVELLLCTCFSWWQRKWSLVWWQLKMISDVAACGIGCWGGW